MGSTRLPGKSLLELAGLPLVAHVARRVVASKSVDVVAFVIPNTNENDVLADYVTSDLKMKVYRGADLDVLDRFASAVIAEQPDIVVRITADDPLKDPALIDKAINLMLLNPKLDYVSNNIEASYPEGLDVEVIRASALLEAAAEAILEIDREHVTPFIWRQPDRYEIGQFQFDRDLSGWRLTLDTNADREFLTAVLTSLPEGDTAFAFETLVSILEESPSLLRLMPKDTRSVDQLNLPISERAVE